ADARGQIRAHGGRPALVPAVHHGRMNRGSACLRVTAALAVARGRQGLARKGKSDHRGRTREAPDRTCAHGRVSSEGREDRGSRNQRTKEHPSDNASSEFFHFLDPIAGSNREERLPTVTQAST